MLNTICSRKTVLLLHVLHIDIFLPHFKVNKKTEERTSLSHSRETPKPTEDLVHFRVFFTKAPPPIVEPMMLLLLLPASHILILTILTFSLPLFYFLNSVTHSLTCLWYRSNHFLPLVCVCVGR